MEHSFETPNHDHSTTSDHDGTARLPTSRPLGLSPMNLDATENMVEDEEMVKFTVRRDLEALKMEDETMAEGKAPFQKLVQASLAKEQREKAVRTPPLPSAWAVQNLLTQPLCDKEMPAIDETRIDATGQ